MTAVTARGDDRSRRLNRQAIDIYKQFISLTAMTAMTDVTTGFGMGPRLGRGVQCGAGMGTQLKEILYL